MSPRRIKCTMASTRSTPQKQAKLTIQPQWVGMALFAQALTFYVPHFLWKTWEGKKVSLDPPFLPPLHPQVERLVSGIISPVASDDVKRKHTAAIADYFFCNKRRHVLYGLRWQLFASVHKLHHN